ncbi:MAG: hypothetical protein ABI230_06965 [Aestuariivirga sp.]
MSQQTSIIFCDDIRVERNGKYIVIGVYGDVLVPRILPQTLNLSVFLRIWDLPVGRHKLAFTLSVDGKANPAQPFEINVVPDTAITLAGLLGLTLHITKPGAITFTLSGVPGQKDISEVLKVFPVPTNGGLIQPAPIKLL